MVDFKKLSAQAKDLVEKRGGTDGLKKDAAELQGIAKGKGTLSEKAKAAAQALKSPGAADAAAPKPPADTGPKPDSSAPKPHGDQLSADDVERKAERRKARAERKAGEEDPAL